MSDHPNARAVHTHVHSADETPYPYNSTSPNLDAIPLAEDMEPVGWMLAP